MTETPHIFDEFAMNSEDCNAELVHRKRTVLEPLVFGILKRKYAELFHKAFQTYIKPKGSDKCVLIIERRIHENLEFILHNVAYYADGWEIAIICSDVNFLFIKDILGDRRNEVTVLPLFSGNPDRDTGRNEYNSMLKSADFYESLPAAWKHLFVVQMDSYFVKPIPDIVTNYDFFAAVTSWNIEGMAGGMSYRRRAAMIDICKRFDPEGKVWSEDVFFCEGSKALGYSLPPYEIARTFIAESVLGYDFFGTHQWWTYWYPVDYGCDKSFYKMLTCETKENA